MLATALFAFVAAQASPVVGLAVQPAVGLAPGEAAALVGRVQDELVNSGLSVVEATPVDPSCATDATCVDQVRGAAAEPHDALLVIELVRIGPVVQVTATGAAGERRATGSVSLDEDQLAQGPVLPPEIMAWVKELAPAAPAVPSKLEPVTTEPPFELTPLKSGALFAGGAGIIALSAGIILVATSEPVLQDPKSLGDEKEQARVLGMIGLGATVLGVAGIGSAVGLWLID